MRQEECPRFCTVVLLHTPGGVHLGCVVAERAEKCWGVRNSPFWSVARLCCRRSQGNSGVRPKDGTRISSTQATRAPRTPTAVMQSRPASPNPIVGTQVHPGITSPPLSPARGAEPTAPNTLLSPCRALMGASRAPQGTRAAKREVLTRRRASRRSKSPTMGSGSRSLQARPPPLPRTNWTRLVRPPVLTGHGVGQGVCMRGAPAALRVRLVRGEGRDVSI